jgi:hypothetical protein
MAGSGRSAFGFTSDLCLLRPAATRWAETTHRSMLRHKFRARGASHCLRSRFGVEICENVLVVVFTACVEALSTTTCIPNV